MSEYPGQGDAFKAADTRAELARFKAASRKAQAARAAVDARDAEHARTLQARLREETRARRPEWFS